METSATVQYKDGTYDSQIAGWGFGVELTASPSENASIGFNAVTVQDSLGSMQMTATGLTFPDSTVMTTAAAGGVGYSSPYLTSGGSNITAIDLGSGSLTVNYVYGGTLVTAANVTLISGLGGVLTFEDGTTQSTAADLTGYATETYVNSQGFITSSALTPYLLSATAATTYAPIAAAVPTGGTTGQVLTKTSATNYALSWTTPAVGDKYYTTSTTSLSVSNGNKSLTVDTGLSYTTQQSVIIAYDAAHHMHGIVTSYNISTGAMVVDVAQHTGTGG
jgi:hypothetical protein